MTLRHSTAQNIQTSFFSREVFLASPLAAPGNEEAKKMTVTSGRKCLELFRKQSPIGLLAKTLLASSAWDSTAVFLTWKEKVTKCNRLLFQLAPSTPRTEGIGCGLLFTPMARECEQDLEKFKERMKKYPNGTTMPSLSNQIAMLPTPQRRDFRTGEAHRWENTQERSRNLNDALAHELPPNNSTGTGLKLQPAFVEWMMGYPDKWTELID